MLFSSLKRSIGFFFCDIIKKRWIIKIDLHTHTIYSDGELTVRENVERAKKIGLDGIAITDHDNIDSWKDIDEIEDFTVIKGVELSTFHDNESIHLLGYYLNNNKSYEELDEFLRELRIKRKKRLAKMIELLKQFKIELTEDEILKEADGAVGRPHVAKAIMKKYPERNYTKNLILIYLAKKKKIMLSITNIFHQRN